MCYLVGLTRSDRSDRLKGGLLKKLKKIFKRCPR